MIPYDALNASQSLVPVAGTDIIQLSNMVGNNGTFFVSGGQGLLFDNNSAATLLVIVGFQGASGDIQIICEPWDTLPLDFISPIDSVTVWNMSTTPLPTPYSPVHSAAIISGYFCLSSIGDSSILKKGRKERHGPTWYDTFDGVIPSGVSVLLANTDHFNTPASVGGVNLPMVIDFANKGSTNNNGGLSYTFYDRFSFRRLGGNAGITLDQPITLVPGQSLSMDVSEVGPCLYVIRGTGSAAAGGSDMQVTVRGR